MLFVDLMVSRRSIAALVVVGIPRNLVRPHVSYPYVGKLQQKNTNSFAVKLINKTAARLYLKKDTVGRRRWK